MAPVPGVPEILIIVSLLFGGGMGLPIGMPPAPEDPMMAQVAPDQCLFYSTWAGRAEADPNSPNSIDRLLNEPEIKRTITVLEQELRRGLARARRDGGPQETLLVTAIPQVLELLLTQSGAMYIEDLQMAGPNVKVQAAAVIGLGEMEPRIRRLLADFKGTLPEEKVSSVELSGHRFDQMKPAADAPTLQWGIAKGYFILGAGEGSVEQLLANSETEAPAWLTNSRSKLEIERLSSFAYADLQQWKELIPPAAGFRAEMVIDLVGLRNVTQYAAVTGLNQRGVVSKSLLMLDGKATGLLEVVEAEPLTRQDFEGIPRDALLATVVRFDAGKVFQATMQSLARIQPQVVGEVQRQIRSTEDNLGFRLQEDIFKSLGDVWRVHTSRSNGGLLTGWTLSVDLQDAQKLQRVADRLMGLAAGRFGNQRRAPRIRHYDVPGATIHFLSIPDNEFVVAPAWCITQDQLIVGLFPQTITGYLADRAEPSLADSPELADVFAGGGPVAVSYVDTRSIFELIYPAFYFAGRAAMVELQRQEELALDITILPSVTAIAKHLRPTVASVSRVDDGVLLVREQSIPGGSVGATAPVTVALLLPAVQAAREAARRTQSQNNLKQFAIAMHNFHDTYRGLPASYNTDDDGKPLLSWRVHILPYIEQTTLYDQFRFDEPWDSEHNKQLVERMPPIFSSPNSRFPVTAGKTNYQGLANEESVLQPPPEKSNGVEHPTSIGFRDILDGTSNTIMLVEVPDDQAVIWTKPEDFKLKLSDPNPIRNLVGMRPGGFLAAFCDGSVRFISESIDRATLKALFTRAGGEPVGNF